MLPVSEQKGGRWLSNVQKTTVDVERACAEVPLLPVSVPSFTRFLFCLIDNHCSKKLRDTGSGLDPEFLGFREKAPG